MVLGRALIGLVGAIMLSFEAKDFACACDALLTNNYRGLWILVPAIVIGSKSSSR